ncbi:sirohydrochlorin chelatase [Gandjariella thermophila]|uniref:Cobalamin biosynthesis protein CbiX n=1 Tax=Gandjariella thermophila TaxID=1931992 RepID=A0A4D4J641_9PSEU|nr:sirohydrochlorin chelatase [Gandjariella thermophila]GDY30049.1 hypothetical protein GTS_16820 [Gandjariella thermophila]
MTLVLVAHGTRDPAGAVEIDAIAAALRDRLGGVAVEVAYADVRGPGVADVLRAVRGPAVVVPAFLAAGYHVRVDVPAQVADSGQDGVVVSAPLGPASALTAAVYDRLVEAGWRRGDAVVLAAAGSSDPRALADVRRAATLLSAHTGGPVRLGYVTTAAPRVPDAVAACRADGRQRVAVASWLLAPGLFQRSLADAGADVVARPIGAHPRLIDAILRRYHDARCYREAA